MPATAKGIYYPASTDFVQMGPTQIAGLAASVDALLDNYRPNIINGLSWAFGTKTALTGPTSGEAIMVQTSSFTLTAPTWCEFIGNWYAVQPSVLSACFVNMKLNGGAGTQIGGARANVDAGTYGMPGTIHTFKQLAAGTYTACLTVDSFSGTITGYASTIVPATILVRPM